MLKEYESVWINELERYDNLAANPSEPQLPDPSRNPAVVTHETPEKAPPTLLVESTESQFALAADDSIAEVEEDLVEGDG